jgi:peptide deformylase
MRGARGEAEKINRPRGEIDFYKLALTTKHQGAEILRKPAMEVPKITEEIRNLCARMLDVTRRDPKCWGIAAPQVNRPYRIITVQDNDGMVYCFVNPTLTPREGSLKQVEYEGCYSLPDKRVKIERWTAVEVTGIAPFGTESKVVFTGMAARAAQHEMDHLSGTLIDTYGEPEDWKRKS